MAEATRFENLQSLADTNTITGPAIFHVMLTAVGAVASLTLTIGSNSVQMTAPANTSVVTPSPIRIGAGSSAVVALTGVAATAVAIHEIE